MHSAFRLSRFPRPWPIVWAWIMLTNIILGLVQPESQTLIIIRLSGIALCFIYTLRYFPRDHLLHWALFITLIADLILAANHTAEFGVIIFFIAQAIHLFRLSPRRSYRNIIIFLALATLCSIASFIWPIIPPMYTIVLFYIATLCTNVYISWCWKHQAPDDPAANYALLGFILFLCCDICIGASYLSFMDIIPAFVYIPANFFGWFFYYPSQILVSNSSKCGKITTKGR